MEYCDTSKIVIERTNKDVVYNIISKKHYANTWTASSDIYAIYYDSGEHQFFSGKELSLYLFEEGLGLGVGETSSSFFLNKK